MATKLVFTHYLDATPASVEAGLTDAVETAAEGRSTRTEVIPGGLRVAGGLGALDGSEIRVEGTDRLTEVRVSVPWHTADAATRKALEASRFAGLVAGEVDLAA